MKQTYTTLRNCLFILFFLACGSSCSEYSHEFNLVYVKCNGEFNTYSSADGNVKTITNGFVGHVQRGLFYKGGFYAIGIENNIIKTNVTSGASDEIFKLSDIGFLKHKLWNILYVDNDTIIISAYVYKEANQAGHQHKYYLLEIDRDTCQINDVSINNCENKFISKQGKTIYYSDKFGDIFKINDDGENKSLDIKGTHPTPSPDGSQLAYIEYGIIWNKVCIFDFSSKKKHDVIRFIGKKSAFPVLSWSKDGRLLAVGNDSDLFARILFVVESKSGRKIKELKKTYACNWFFVDEQNNGGQTTIK